MLKNDHLCATLESSQFKLSLEQEKEKHKDTLEAYDARCNQLMETVAEKDQEIDDLHKELSVCGNVTACCVCMMHVPMCCVLYKCIIGACTEHISMHQCGVTSINPYGCAMLFLFLKL